MYTKSQIIESLQSAANEKGRSWRCDEWRAEHRSPCVSTITQNFGSWNEAWLAAGCPAKSAGRSRTRLSPSGWDPEVVLSTLREQGYMSTTEWIAKKRSPSVPTIRAMFGSWRQAYTTAGVLLTAEQQFEHAKNQLREFGRYCTVFEWNRIHASTKAAARIKKSLHVQRWRDAWRLAGIEPVEPIHVTKPYPKNPRLTTYRQEEAWAWLQTRKSPTKIAKEMGISRSALYQMWDRLIRSEGPNGS